MNTTVKCGSRQNLRPRVKHLKGRSLNFEQKRQIAKLVVADIPRKNICADWNISHAFLCQIVKEFVVVRKSEKYPDDTQWKQESLSL